MTQNRGNRPGKSTWSKEDIRKFAEVAQRPVVIAPELAEQLVSASRDVAFASSLAEQMQGGVAVRGADKIKAALEAMDHIKALPILRPAQVLSKPIKLNPREKKILPVIDRGVKSEAYCRELHAAGLKPPRTWVSQGCPSTYPQAWLEKEWNKRIRQEKYRLTRKVIRMRRGD